jgi:hypothetical protein
MVVCVCDRGRGKTDCDSSESLYNCQSISLQFKIEKLLDGQPMLIFASDVWVNLRMECYVSVTLLLKV